MASTTSSSQISFSTIAIAATGILATSGLAYALYFDQKRRSDPEFRRSLRRQQKKVSRQNAESAKDAERQQKDRVRNAVDEEIAAGFPQDPEETEAYFMQEVARGEGMCADGSDPIDAALSFYRALKVYPQPKELVQIYDKTVPKPILDILAEMIAFDTSLSVTGSSAGSDVGFDKVE